MIFAPSEAPLLFALQDVIEALKARGHEVKEAKKFYNVVNAVEKVDGCVSAVSDKRKDGEAAGY